MIGQRINNVQILRLMYEGGMGNVYEAEHVLMRRRFAVKVLRRELGTDNSLVERFLNEARATNTIRHPNIVEITDAGQLPSGLPYYVMELLVGETLADRLLRTGPFSVALAVDITLQTASALQAAHQLGIVHRDLKPENLFLTADTRVESHDLVKVLDFGIAKLRGEVSSVRTNAGVVFGTPAYMAPEQCSGRPDDIDHRADVYALGVILYEMLAGAPPFEHSNAMELMMMQLSTAPPPIASRRADVPDEVATAVMKALEKVPDKRFGSLAEMMVALGHRRTLVPSVAPLQGLPRPVEPNVGVIENGLQTSTTTPATVQTNLQSKAGRSWSNWGLGALLLGALAGVLIGGWWFVRGSEQGERADNTVGLEAAPTASTPSVIVAGFASSVTLDPPPTPAPVASALPEVAAKTPRSASIAAPQHTLAKLQRPALPRSSSGAVSPPPKDSSSSARTSPTAPAAPAVIAANGFLTLDSSPWSQVFLGGRLLGSTPLVRVPLPPGTHVLTLKNPEAGSSTSYVVVIEAERLVSRFVGWEEE